jgi:hypothetical protein
MSSNAGFKNFVPSPSHSVGPTSNLKSRFLGIEISQELRIGQKDIYVMALAVINLQHHRGAAAKRPRIDNGLFGVYLTDKSTGYSE